MPALASPPCRKSGDERLQTTAADGTPVSPHECRLELAAVLRVIRSAVLAGRNLAHAITPQMVGAAVFIGGAVLLLSAATPTPAGRLAFLRHVVPLPFVEASHLLSSVVGLLLMILARGLLRRLDGAFHLTVMLLCGGIVFSLLKGGDYEEALVLSVILALLGANRRAFYRQASLLDRPLSTAWLAAATSTIGGAVWLGLFAFRHVEYAQSLWWQFAYDGDASRFLRAGVAVTAVAAGFLVVMLLRPSSRQQEEDTPDEETIEKIVAGSLCTNANLALAGDKRFLLSDDSDAFIMYQVQGRSWIALGDPVGEPAARADLLWRFRELCDRHDGWPVFYQVTATQLPLYLDLGLTLVKLGEEARVDLRAFSLEGARRRRLRHAVRRAEKEGAIFEVVAAADLPAILPELRSVSDVWLAQKKGQEKGFSVGCFSDSYMRHFDCAVVRREGEIVAFTNIWRTADSEEISVDLMRQGAGAPYGIMDFLFVNLMLVGQAQGCKWFNLGMAPLSGLESHQLSPAWNRLGAFAFQHGEHFYNFEGLRAYKEKFDPLWTPKYLAVPGHLVLPRVLLDLAKLISHGNPPHAHTL